jgi:hypothetical protein
MRRGVLPPSEFAGGKYPGERGGDQHADQEKDQRMGKADQLARALDRELLGLFRWAVRRGFTGLLRQIRQTVLSAARAILPLGVLLRLAVHLLAALLKIVVWFSGQRQSLHSSCREAWGHLARTPGVSGAAPSNIAARPGLD